MDVKRRKKKDVEILEPARGMDLFNFQGLARHIEMMIAEGKCKVVVNFSNVSYLDSSGIRTLISCQSNLKTHGGDIRLSNVTDTVRRIIELSGLIPFLKLFETESEAVASFKS